MTSECWSVQHISSASKPKRMEVRDAETGELVVVECSPTKSKRPAVSLPPISSNSPTKPSATIHATQGNQHSQTKFEESRRVKFPETQSYRPMGEVVNWSKGQREREERAQERFLTSIQGLRSQLQRRDLEPEQRQELEMQILEKMKAQYAEQVQRMVAAEMSRELAREVETRLEVSAIGKERIGKKHDRDRAFYRSQIERVREECELSLVATMAQYNLLR